MAAEFDSLKDGQRRRVPVIPRPEVPEGTVLGLRRALDDVAWSTLRHAYGGADEVPALLLAASIGTDEIRAPAWWELWGNIHHQGTVYEATVPAIPFIDDIARWRGHPDRVQAIAFLRAIALADGTFAVQVREAVSSRAIRLFQGWSKEPPPVQRAVTWLATAYPDLAADHPALVQSVPMPMRATWAETAANSVRRVDLDDDEMDRRDQLERWSLSGWSSS